MSAAKKALESASRRELQALAKELQLCRGNAKSDVIVSHAVQFLDDHPKDGEQQVLGALGDSPEAVAEKTKESPKPKKKEAAAVAVVKEKKQPEDEPTVTVKSVEKKNSNVDAAAKETKKVTPKDKKKTKQTSSTAKSTATTASPAKSPKVSVKASPAKSPKTSVKASPKKSPTSKSKPSEVEKKKVVTKKEEAPVSKKTAPVGRKAEIKVRKTVEAIVKSTPDLTFVGDSRVRCSTTGHEMKADLEVINKYITGKRYQKARNLKLSFAKYAPMFVDHPDESKADMLWCNVTESAIARDVKRIQEHIAAPKYQKELPIWKEQEAAKKKAEEEEAQRRAARIEAAKKRRLAADSAAAAESKRPAKRAKTVDSDRK